MLSKCAPIPSWLSETFIAHYEIRILVTGGPAPRVFRVRLVAVKGATTTTMMMDRERHGLIPAPVSQTPSCDTDQFKDSEDVFTCSQRTFLANHRSMTDSDLMTPPPPCRQEWITQPYRVTSELYQACLKYTMLAKLAPTWNKAGEWLIQGRDFLMHTGYANGVKFDFMVTADEQYASACATVLRIKPLQHSIYPSVCLRNAPMQALPRIEPKPIISTFLQDLHGKVGSVCGQPFKFEPNVRHTLSTLYTSSQDVQGSGPNLSRTSNTAKRQCLLRDMYNQSKKQGEKITNDMSSLSSKNSMLRYDVMMPGMLTNSSTAMHEQERSQMSASMIDSTILDVHTVSVEGLGACNVYSSDNSVREVSMLKSNTLTENSISESGPIKQKPIIPVFKSKIKKSCLKEKSAAVDNIHKTAVDNIDKPAVDNIHKSAVDNIDKPAVDNKHKSAEPILVAETSCFTTQKSTTESMSSERQSSGKQKSIAGKLREKVMHKKMRASLEEASHGQIVPSAVTESHHIQKRKLGSKDDAQIKRPKLPVSEVDIEMLANQDQLGRVNVATLTSWLKSRGIHCKSKEKKSDLMERVKSVLALTSAEP
ncbi:hypothetical protein C0Q70_19467 [Pomacea canaliculata]|uniref:DUF4708 domain-containing protein n=1 Tax=Pomacea canaliculata TaxID=400727 RepID=A0A2T7NJF0_POMCA|nr:hypothetical protein C0Q70_19467 [Pomacea canaliculata]